MAGRDVQPPKRTFGMSSCPPQLGSGAAAVLWSPGGAGRSTTQRPAWMRLLCGGQNS